MSLGRAFRVQRRRAGGDEGVFHAGDRLARHLDISQRLAVAVLGVSGAQCQAGLGRQVEFQLAEGGGGGCILCAVFASRAGAFDWACLDLVMADTDKAFRRQAQDRVVATQAHKPGKWRRACASQSAVGRPRVAFAGGAEALGVIDLIAVTRLDVAVDLRQCLFIVMGTDIGLHGLFQ